MNDSSSENTVLVVDDNPAGLYLTAKMLRMENFRIIEASSGQEALDKVQGMPDVVILDVKLPDINGFEVCKRIKSNPALAAIPVIHLSATYLDPDSKALGLDSGADAYLTHPVEPKVLIATINAVLRIKMAETKLAEAALQWKATFDSINDAVCLINCTGVINRVNKKFIEICRTKRENLIGTELSAVLPEFNKYDFAFFSKWQTAAAASDSIGEFSLDMKDYSVSIDPVINSDGSCAGFVFKLRDITREKESEADIKRTLSELENLNLQLERSNKELEHFAYAASHDLQEPLRMIASFTKILSRRIDISGDEKSKEYFNIVLEAATRMQKLIHDLLDYSRVTTRGMKFEPVDMEKILQDVTANLKIIIEETKAEITHDPLPIVLGDSIQLAQLLQNLISNSIKFRGENKPKIHIGLRKDMSDRWVFSVRDNGIGIEKEYFDRIFVIFQRLHERERYEGTGIGLALCKRIVEHHGGRIWVESSPGKGSMFHFSIPAKLNR
ncbi:MAG: sensor histidine kinase [Bacillota bacterium]